MYTEQDLKLGLTQLNTFRGLRVIRDDANMVEHHEDWSNVRSPGRAKRRRPKHKQCIQICTTPRRDVLVSDTMLIGHTQTIDAIMKLMIVRNELQNG